MLDQQKCSIQEWPNISFTILIQDRRLFEPGSGLQAQRVLNKDLHYQNSITKSYTR